METVNQQALEQNTEEVEETGDLIGTVLLKNGKTIEVKLEELKQFLKDNFDEVVVQKHPNMGKRRV